MESAETTSIEGTVDVSGRGPLLGRGQGLSGSGGSYGGSGGQTQDMCAAVPGVYFSVYSAQIGSLNVAEEVEQDPVSGGEGSGGGVDVEGGGRGGGLIQVQGKDVLLAGGALLSMGSTSVVAGVGSGSGGGVSILAVRSLASIDMVITVTGGAANTESNIAGGSGGRVTVQASEALDVSAVWGLQGGGNSSAPWEGSCLTGSSGTLLWISSRMGTSVLYAHNNAQVSFAATLLTETTKIGRASCRESV